MTAAEPSRLLPTSFWRQWSASAISNLGDGIGFVAMPLFALSLTTDERLLSLVTFAAFVPWILFALPIGVIVDRHRRRRLMITANVARFALVSTIALGAAGGWLSIWALVGLLLVIGSFEVLFDSSAQAFLPMLVAPDDLARANGLLFAAEVVAGSIAGLSIGAVLFDVTPSLPFWVNAGSFAIAALIIASIRSRRVTRPTTVSSDSGFAVGMRWLRSNQLLRTLALMFALTNLGLMFGQGIFVKYAIVELDVSTSQYGILLAITAMGAASGGLLGDRVIRAFGLRASVVAPYVVFGIANLVIGLAPAAWIVACAGFVLGMAITVWNVVTVTIRQRVIPSDRFGRVNSVYRWLGAAASAVGVAAGGWVAYATNLRAPFLIGGAITLLAGALFAVPVLRSLATAENGP